MTQGFDGRLIARLKGVCRHCERAVVARAPKVEGQGGAPVDVGHNGYKAVYVALHQTHLPTLEDAGAAIYERTGKRIRPTGHTADYAALVRFVDGGVR